MKEKIIKKKLLAHYKNAKSDLAYTNDYELLVSIMLSAQCTDKRVNIITPALFKEYPDIKSLARAKLSSLLLLIQTCSFFNNKAKNLIKMAIKVRDEHACLIPNDIKALEELAGVGPKTARVFLIEARGANLMAVDTHVFRVAKRLNLSKANSVDKTSEELSKLFKTELGELHIAMVLFGRYICKAKKPACDKCFLLANCSFSGS